MRRSLTSMLIERLISRKLWRMWRDGLEMAAVPGSGGIVFLGDSITHNARWDLMFPNIATRNFGINGERSEHLLTRLEPIISIQPTKVFILIGTNDLAVGRTVDEISADVDGIVHRLQTALPDCTVYLQSVLPRAKKFAARIHALNARYRQIADQRGAEFIDLFPAFDDGTGTLKKELTYDVLHLMGQGYRLWHDIIESRVVSGPRR